MHFRFEYVDFRNRKSKKEKWRCGQNLDLNPTYLQGVGVQSYLSWDKNVLTLYLGIC